MLSMELYVYFCIYDILLYSIDRIYIYKSYINPITNMYMQQFMTLTALQACPKVQDVWLPRISNVESEPEKPRGIRGIPWAAWPKTQIFGSGACDTLPFPLRNSMWMMKNGKL